VPSLKRFIYAGDAATPAGCLSYEHMLAAATAVPDAMRGGDDTFGLFYTGGTRNAVAHPASPSQAKP
jgi:hypothetical protein